MYHKQLRFQLGNLLNRIQSPALFPKIGEFRPDLSGEQEGPLHNALTGLRDVVEHHMEAYEVSKACERIMDVVMLVGILSPCRFIFEGRPIRPLSLCHAESKALTQKWAYVQR